MQMRGVISDKQQLISALEQVFTSARSEADFYSKLQEKKFELYSRNNTIVGVKLRRKHRFKSLGYNKEILQKLDKHLTQNKRMDMLKRIREHQEKQQNKERSGRERTRNRGR